MKTVAIQGTLRTDINKRSTKAVRKQEQTPCVIYGGENNVHFSADTKSFKTLFSESDLQVAEIDIDGNVHRAFIKDAQFHPVTDQLLHVDFQALLEDRAIVTEIPIKLSGLAKGVRAGGKLMLKQRKVKVKSLPKYLVPVINVDVSHLELGKSVRIRDIQLDGVEIMNSPAIPIASVEITRALRAAKAAEAKDK